MQNSYVLLVDPRNFTVLFVGRKNSQAPIIMGTMYVDKG